MQSHGKISEFCPRFAKGEYTPDFLYAFSNRTHFRACGRFWLSSVQRARRVADEIKIEDKRRIVVKARSADSYVGRPIQEIALVPNF